MELLNIGHEYYEPSKIIEIQAQHDKGLVFADSYRLVITYYHPHIENALKTNTTTMRFTHRYDDIKVLAKQVNKIISVTKKCTVYVSPPEFKNEFDKQLKSINSSTKNEI